MPNFTKMCKLSLLSHRISQVYNRINYVKLLNYIKTYEWVIGHIIMRMILSKDAFLYSILTNFKTLIFFPISIYVLHSERKHH